MNPSISRYVSAKANSQPIETPFTAPVIKGDADYDFLTIIQTFADHRTDSGESHYHSLSRWDDAHASWGHLGTTCVCLGYTGETADDVGAVLTDAGLLHYRIPIVEKRKDAVLFALPTRNHFSHTDTTRAASIIAHGIGIKGVLKNTYFSTYFFRFQKSAKVTQGGTDMIDNTIIEDNGGLFVRMSDWMAK